MGKGPLENPAGASPGFAKRWAARLVEWLRRNRDARSWPRYQATALCAYSWDGGVCAPHKVMNISESGACILTTDPWQRPGTILKVALQRLPQNGDKPAVHPETLHVISQVVRSDSGRVAVRFIFARPEERLHLRKFLAGLSSEGGISMNSGGTRRQGQALIEFALVALMFLSIVFLSFNFFFWTFAKAALQNAVRDGARYAITGQTTGPHQDASIRQVVRNNAFGLLGSAPDSSITVEYFAADGSATGSNAAGNIVVISVLNFTPATIAPVPSSLFMSRLSSGMTVRAVDKVEPFGGPPATR